MPFKRSGPAAPGAQQQSSSSAATCCRGGRHASTVHVGVRLSCVSVGTVKWVMLVTHHSLPLAQVCHQPLPAPRWLMRALFGCLLMLPPLPCSPQLDPDNVSCWSALHHWMHDPSPPPTPPRAVPALVTDVLLVHSCCSLTTPLS
jgi:hypothetical protein